MLVDFKGNHLGATATLPWLWQAKGPACKGTKGVPRVSQGGSQSQLGPEIGVPDPGTHVSPSFRQAQAWTAQGCPNQIVPGGRSDHAAPEGSLEGAQGQCQRLQRQCRWRRGWTGAGRASASDASDVTQGTRGSATPEDGGGGPDATAPR
jgi:hypothetical protein